MKYGYENRKNCSCQNEFEEFGRTESLFKKFVVKLGMGGETIKDWAKTEEIKRILLPY